MKTLLIAILLISNTALNSFSQNVPSYVSTNGLVGYWPFNGNVIDESLNNHNGIIQPGSNGTVSFVNDRNGLPSKSIEFASIVSTNSLGPYIELLNTENLLVNSAFTVNYFVYINSNNQIGEIINKGPDNLSGIFFARIINGDLQTAVSASGGHQQNNFTLNSWQMVTFTRDSLSQVKVYINETLVNQTTSVPISSNFTNYYFGAMPSGGSNGLYYPYQGKIDDVGFWNRALTQQEITDLYNGCKSSVVTNPINQNVNTTNEAKFGVSTTDSLATFQWQTDLGVGFQNLSNAGQFSGVITDTLTVSNASLSNNNQVFRCIIGSGTCSDTSSIATLTVQNTADINETSINIFEVYPNPAKHIINIKTNENAIGSTYQLFDHIGKVVLNGRIESNDSIIELGNLNTGVYILSTGANQNQKIIIN